MCIRAEKAIALARAAETLVHAATPEEGQQVARRIGRTMVAPCSRRLRRQRFIRGCCVHARSAGRSGHVDCVGGRRVRAPRQVARGQLMLPTFLGGLQ